MNMYSIKFSEDELGALAGHLISAIILMRGESAQIYASMDVSKNADMVMSKTISMFEDVLGRLLIHLPNDFRERAEKRQIELNQMGIMEALEDTGNILEGKSDLNEWLKGPDLDENPENG